MPKSNILKSWKEIASYLGVSTRTAQRWKQEHALPVRQPGTGRRSAVLGFAAELDDWLQRRSAHDATGAAEEAELAAINATSVLWRRDSRPPQYAAEIGLLLALYRTWAHADNTSLLEDISTFAREQCKAESAGFSVLERGERPIFRWTATQGRMAEFEGGTTPADFSPCGVCLARNSPQLFVYPERLYAYLKTISPIRELLLIPIHDGNAPVGTIWVLCHDTYRRFDREDVRVMTDLAGIATAAFQHIGILSLEFHVDKLSRPLL